MFTNRHSPVLPQLPPHQYTFFFRFGLIVILSKHSLTLPTPNPTPAQKIFFFFFQILIVDPPPPFRPFFFSDLKSLSICQNIHFIISPAPLHPPPPPAKKKKKKDLDSLPIQKKNHPPSPAPPRLHFFFFFFFEIWNLCQKQSVISLLQPAWHIFQI